MGILPEYFLNSHVIESVQPGSAKYEQTYDSDEENNNHEDKVEHWFYNFEFTKWIVLSH